MYTRQITLNNYLFLLLLTYNLFEIKVDIAGIYNNYYLIKKIKIKFAEVDVFKKKAT